MGGASMYTRSRTREVNQGEPQHVTWEKIPDYSMSAELDRLGAEAQKPGM